MRRAIIYSSSFAAILALAYLWPLLGGSRANDNTRGAMCIAGHCCCTARAEAADAAAPKGSQPRLTLDPNQFVGPVKEAYTFAEQHPEILAELHCYCGCDKAEGHQNLLDCYRGTARRVVRNLHRRGVAGEADVGAGIAGRSDT